MNIKKYLSYNPNLFQLSKEQIYKLALEYFSQKKIAKQWRECISNPEYKLCRDRLHKEYHELLA